MSHFMEKYGTVYWTVWFFFVLPLTFGIPEAMALKWKGLSLSMYTWRLSQQWPPIIFLLGMLVGGLMVHFWWHWNPDGGLKGIGG